MASASPTPLVAVCESNPAIRRTLAASLRRMRPAVRLRICATGDEILSAMRDGARCVFISAAAPGATPADILRQARAEGMTAPVVVITPANGARSRSAFLNAGAYDCLDVREITPQTVRLTVRHALRAGTAAPAPRTTAQKDDLLSDGHALAAAIIRASPLAVLCLDREYRVRLWSPAAERMFGWSAEEVIGRELPIVPPAYMEAFKALREAALHGRMLTGIEVRRRRKDGSMVDVSLSTAPLRGPEGTVVGIIAILEDVTQTKRLRQRLLHSQRMEAVARLARALAHDLNNTLAVVHGYSEAIMRRSSADSPVYEHARQIAAAAQRCAAATREILSFATQHPRKPEPVDLTVFVSECRQLLSDTLGPRNNLVINAASQPCPVIADRRQLEQVLVNFAINARDVMPRGGTLTISCARVEIDDSAAIRGNLHAGQYVKLSVADTGPGMEAGVRQRIFDPLFTTRPGQREGLGLTIAWEIIRAHGGTILVHGEPGTGAVFDVLLPLGDQQTAGP